MRIDRPEPSPTMNEADFMRQIIATERGREGLAVRLGWDVLHVKPAAFVGDPSRPERKRFVTPTSGSLGSGWPDLILVRGSRIVAAELKAGRNKPSPEQVDVLAKLAAAGIETYVWWPRDWPSILVTLGAREPCGVCRGRPLDLVHGPAETCRSPHFEGPCPDPEAHHPWVRPG